MNIIFLGNCQTLTYAKYFSDLMPNKNIKWVCPDLFSNLAPKANWPISKSLWGADLIENVVVMCQEEKHKLLSNCDFIVCNVMNKNISPLDNYDDLCNRYGEEKVVSITTHHENLNGMIQRESVNKTHLKASSLYTDFPDKAKTISINHPNVFVVLECVRMICKHLNIPFFNDEDYHKHLKEDWVNGTLGQQKHS